MELELNICSNFMILVRYEDGMDQHHTQSEIWFKMNNLDPIIGTRKSNFPFLVKNFFQFVS